MPDNISKAVEMAKSANRGRFPSGLQPRRKRIPPTAKPVEVSQQVMQNNRLIIALDDQRLQDCYALLSARVLHQVGQRHINVIGVTSPSGNDGKSLTAANLALSIAMAETHPVLLLDADLRRPSLAALFGVQPAVGLGDYLAGKAAVDDVLLRLPIGGLSLLPGLSRPGYRPAGLSSEPMQHLMLNLKAQYADGIVIVDMPPALVGGDVVSLLPYLDGTLLVVADRRTREESFRTALRILENTVILGTVLNFADEIISSEGDYAGG